METPSSQAAARTSDDLRSLLLLMEERFWIEGADYYRRHLAAEAEMVLPGVGVLSRARTIDAIAAGPRWRSVRFSDAHVLRLSGDSAQLVYRADAEREGAGAYAALATSTYVIREGDWQLVCHQQTAL